MLSAEKYLQNNVKAMIIGISKKMKAFHFLWHLELEIIANSKIDNLSKTLQIVRTYFAEGK